MDAAALLTLTTADVDASVATTVAVVTRSGWLLFYWESLMCLAVADLYQAIVVAAAKVTYAMSCHVMLCYAMLWILFIAPLLLPYDAVEYHSLFLYAFQSVVVLS